MMKNQTAKSRWLVSASAIGLLALASTAAAATDTKPTTAGTDAVAPSDAAPGMRAYIDPKTGQLRQATAEERAAEGKANAAAAKLRDAKIRKIKPVKLANGGVRIDTQGLFEEEATATLNADGSLSYGYQMADGTPIQHDAPAKLEDR